MRWVISGVAGALAACAWWLPSAKPRGVFGRLDYVEFVLASSVSVLALLVVIAALGPAATWRRRFARCAAIGAGLALAVAACELGVRWFASTQSSGNPFYVMEDPGNVSAPDLPYARPPHVDWTGPTLGDLSGGLRDSFTTTVRFRTDSDGFRNDEDVARAELVFIGDSNTEAGNVAVDDTFAARVAHSLGRTYRNLGRAGYSPPDELVVLERYGLPCEPKLVIWQISEQNDLLDCMRYIDWARTGVRPKFDQGFAEIAPSGDGWKRWSPTHRLFDRLASYARWEFEVKLLAKDGNRYRTRFAYSSFGKELDPRYHRGWPAIERALREGAKLLADRGTLLALVFVPMKLRVLEPQLGQNAEIRAEAAAKGGITRPPPLSKRLEAMSAELGALYVDATFELERSANARNVVFFPLDTHPTPLGHEVIAKVVAEALRGKGW